MSPYVFTELYLYMTQLYDFYVHICLQNCTSKLLNYMTLMSPYVFTELYLYMTQLYDFYVHICLQNCTSV